MRETINSMNRFSCIFSWARRSDGPTPRVFPGFVPIFLVVFLAAMHGRGASQETGNSAQESTDHSSFVRDGFTDFRNGRYAEAAEAFAAALEEQPGDPHLCYNYGCALYALGDGDGAKEMFRSAATARDREVSDRARSLLAGIAVRQAASRLADPPEHTPPAEREAVLADVADAEAWYDSILADGADAVPGKIGGGEGMRQNLERLRLWKSRMRRQWGEYDRSRLLKSSLPDYLDGLRKRQEELRRSVSENAVSSPQNLSPRRMQAFYLDSKRQAEIGEDLLHLKDALHEESRRQAEQGDGQAGIPPSTVSSTSPPATTRENETEIKSALDALFGTLEQDSGEATMALRRFRSEEAFEPQKRLAEGLERLFNILTPYEVLLMDMHRRETTALEGDDSGKLSSDPEEGGPIESGSGETVEDEGRKTKEIAEDESRAETSEKAEEVVEETPLSPEECRERAWEQEMLAQSLQTLLEKAREGAVRLAAESETEKTPPHVLPHTIPNSPFATDDPFAALPDGKDERNGQDGVDEPADPQAIQREKLLESMNRALQYGKELDEHLHGAARQWTAGNSDDAVSHQQRARELLDIIVEPLRDAQGNSQQDKDGGEDGQDKQDGRDGKDNADEQDTGDRDGEDDRNENDREKNRDQDEEDSAQDDVQDVDKDRKDDKEDETELKSAENESQNERQRRAEQGLRQVRQRQRQAEELRERIRVYLRQAMPVEKDW